MAGDSQVGALTQLVPGFRTRFVWGPKTRCLLRFSFHNLTDTESGTEKGLESVAGFGAGRVSESPVVLAAELRHEDWSAVSSLQMCLLSLWQLKRWAQRHVKHEWRSGVRSRWPCRNLQPANQIQRRLFGRLRKKRAMHKRLRHPDSEGWSKQAPAKYQLHAKTDPAVCMWEVIR